MNQLRVGGVPEHFNLPWHLAIDSGAFAEIGVEVRFTDYPGGTGAMAQALGAGDIDLALMLTEGAVLDVLRGGTHRLVRVYVESPLVWGIHAPARSTLGSADDMAGLPIAISRFGSGSHLIAVVDALERGFPLSGLEFVVVGDLEGARHAFRDNRAQVFLWERFMTQPLVDSGEFRRIGERVVPWPAFVACARNDVIAGQGAVLRRVLDRVARVASDFHGSPEAAEKIAVRYGIRPDDAARWLEGVRWCTGDRRPDAALDRVISALEAQGALEGLDAPFSDPWRYLD